MKTFVTLLAVLACLLVSDGQITRSRGSPRNQRVSGLIDIDEVQGDNLEVDGSGFDEDDEGGDDDDDLGSGGDLQSGDGIDSPVVTLTKATTKLFVSTQPPRAQTECEKQLGHQTPGAFIPRCTEDGRFEQLQCHHKTGFCWCVDQNSGTELSGTRVTIPATPNCQKIVRLSTTSSTQTPPLTSTVAQPRTTTRARTSTSTSTTQSTTTLRRSTTTEADIINKIDQFPNENEPEIKIDGPPDLENNYIERSFEPKSRPLSFRSSVIGQPGILAAIIGAAVVVLLCLVLLIMFIVYRMHRKSQDPAIYYIDKSARTPLTNSNKKAGYMKAMDQDVYN